MLDVQDIASNLEERAPGFWSSRGGGAVSYPEDGNRELHDVEDQSFWFRHRNHSIIELVRRFPPDGLIFDVGGGNGFVSRALTRTGLTSVVVEPRVDGARRALARGLRPVICSTVKEAGFHSGIAAAIGLFDVVEHIEDDVAFLDGLHLLLRPTGRMYVTVPAYQLLWSFEDSHAGHFRRYTLEGLRRTLERAGYAIDYATYIFTMLAPAVLLGRTLPSQLGVRRHVAPLVEHQPGGPVVTKFVERMFAFETEAIRRGIVLPFGGSCLVAAHVCLPQAVRKR